MFLRCVATGLKFFRWALVVCLATVVPAKAQTDFVPPSAERPAVPETMLQQIRVDGAPGPSGWILTHRNGLTGAETPDQEVQSKTVEHGNGTETPGLVAWEIMRTRNDRCPVQQTAPCPDLVRIIAVPDGFLAVPQEAWVNEGEVLWFYIVPAGMV